MTRADSYNLSQKETLNRLLEQAAVEKDRGKFLELLREINRLRAERWLTTGLKRPGMPRSSMDTDTFDIFSGLPNDRHAAWLETVVGIDRARQRVHQMAADTPGEYFVFHARSRISLIHISNCPASAGTVIGKARLIRT